MKTTLLDFKVIPSVVPADKVSEISISGNGDYCCFFDEIKYIVTVCARDIHDVVIDDEFTVGGYDYKKFEVNPENGIIKVKYKFIGEQEWDIVVSADETNSKKLKELYKEKQINPNTIPFENGIEFQIYSLNEDLYERTPYVGDMHLHSSGSDGTDNPEIVGANMRLMGYDYCAITDHHRYKPSLRAVKSFEEIKTNFKIYHGEEVHNKDMGNFHVVNFGGSYSVNDIILEDVEKFNERIWNESKEEAGDLSEIDSAFLAGYKVITDEIRKSGGLAIFAHPFWVYNHAYNTPENIAKEVFKRKYFDAFEVLGGTSALRNNIQVALYNEMRTENIKIPVVGSTDSHNSKNRGVSGAGNARTIVFAKNIDSICEAVKDMYSVAVETNNGETKRSYGELRLVKFANFLIENYYPMHDRLCSASGILMNEYFKGDKYLKNAIEDIEKKILSYEKEFFGK